MSDIVADTDQAKEHAKRIASIVAALYNELVKDGVPVDEAGWLSRDYLDRLMENDDA